MCDIYTNASIAIRTGRDSYTPPIFQRRGVKHGCPLSPILFNIVLEGLLRHLSSCDAGYTLAGYKMNSLAYADDICLAASSKEETQHLLDRCMEYVKWAGFAFNTKKCGSLCLVNQASPIFVDHLYPPRLDTDVIPALSWEDRYSIWGALLVPFVRMPKRNQVFQGLKQPSTQCRVCGRLPKILAHVLNHCSNNRGLVRERHNAILDRIVRAVPPSLGTKFKEQAIPGTTGNNRPDLTIHKARFNLLPVRTVQARCCQRVPSTQFSFEKPG